MSQEPAILPQTRAWLVTDSGPLAGARHAVAAGVTRVGRGADNEVVIQDPSVSLRHLEIHREGDSFRIRDLGSTNGTYLNGERVEEAELRAHAMIRLGAQGPQLAFVLDEPARADLDKTQVISPDAVRTQAAPAPTPPSAQYEALLSAAVSQARRARASGYRNQTMTIMRHTLDQALLHTNRRSRRVILALVISLVVISAGAGWKILQLRGQKHVIDQRIRDIEAKLQNTAGSAEADRLITQLDLYQGEAEQLQRNLLYRVGVRENEGFLPQQIRILMAEFGAEVYSIPPEFLERVGHYIEQYQGADRPLLEQMFHRAAPKIEVMRRVLEKENLPADLAYIPLVESALTPAGTSAAGAAGLWQLTPATARAYGLHVDGEVDERLNVTKATVASCRYLRELILDFGSGSSVMLALAAYDLGPGKVKQAIMKTVRDPIKQRNFWYLYRIRALPSETREYVPKVVAAMVLGRNPEHFGF